MTLFPSPVPPPIEGAQAPEVSHEIYGMPAFVTLAAVYGELAALADRARAHGAGRVDGPSDTPWNTRDLRTIDPDGNVLVFTAGRPPAHSDEGFSDRMRAWSADQGLGPNGGPATS